MKAWLDFENKTPKTTPNTLSDCIKQEHKGCEKQKGKHKRSQTEQKTQGTPHAGISDLEHMTYDDQTQMKAAEHVFYEWERQVETGDNS